KNGPLNVNWILVEIYIKIVKHFESSIYPMLKYYYHIIWVFGMLNSSSSHITPPLLIKWNLDILNLNKWCFYTWLLLLYSTQSEAFASKDKDRTTSLSIIIPTYNESQNILNLITAIKD